MLYTAGLALQHCSARRSNSLAILLAQTLFGCALQVLTGPLRMYKAFSTFIVKVPQVYQAFAINTALLLHCAFLPCQI